MTWQQQRVIGHYIQVSHTGGDEKQKRDCCKILTHFIFKDKAFSVVGGEGEGQGG